MTYKDGFIMGIIFGFFATFISLGCTTLSVEWQHFIKSLIQSMFILSVIITANQAFRRKSFFSPKWDGFITGVCFSTQMVVWWLYGIAFP